MRTNNPMTEGEALAVLRELVLRVLASHTTEMEGYSYFSSNPGVPKDSYNEVADEIAAAIAAHTAASGGEVPEGRIRFDYTNADGRPDCKIITHDEMRQRYADLREQKNGWPLPPAAVPADALERLVRTWEAEGIRLNGGADKPYTNEENSVRAFVLGCCAGDLAALIPKGADHA